MNVLYVTANSHLRSTTSSLNAIIRQLMPRGVHPVMMFKAGQERGPWHAALAREGFTCYVNPLHIPGKRDLLRAARHTWSLLRLLRRERIDLIHCNEHELYPALRVPARLAGVPILTSLHCNMERGFGHWAFARPYAPAALQFLSRAQLETCRGGIPPDLPADRVKLLMSGLSVDDFLARGSDGHDLRTAWGAGASTVVVGTASGMRRHKHLEDFIRVVARLRSSGRPVLGVIAGGGAFEDSGYRHELEELIAAEGLDGACRLVGNLDPITPFCRAIDVALNTAEMEILSMSMCEAMACRKPVIAYAVGGNPETVPHPWCVVPFGDIDALTSRVKRLVDDVSFRQEMGEAAERHVRAHFDAPVLADRQAAIYREILGNDVLTAGSRATRAREVCA